MSYTLIKNLTTVNYTAGNNRTIKYIVIHYTGNTTDTAKANANYFKNINRGASAHYFVDATTVYQVVEDKNIAWAVGRNYGTNNLFGIVTNANSISIEMCGTNGAVSDATFQNTVILTKALMKTYNISASNVYRHYDVCTKQCPGWTGWGTRLRDSGSLWIKFKNSLNSVGNIPASISKPDIIYQVYSRKWFPEVKNDSDYAGVENRPITGVMIRLSNGDKIKYRAHIIKIGWYDWVDGYNANDFNNGYAGDLRNMIDAIEIKCDKWDIRYKVSTTSNGTAYYPEISDSQNDYAGVFGKAIDKLVCRIA